VDTDPNCLFCKIAAGEIKADLLHRDEWHVAFRDANPQAPFHALLVPVKHISTLDDLANEEGRLIGDILLSATRLARENDLVRGGYRLVWNCGPDAGQSVYHIHLHVLGGRRMAWPPG